MKKILMFSLVAIVALTSATMPKPATFKLDAAKSTFKWTGKKVTGSHWGYVKFTDGQLTVDKGGVTGGTFNVDMNSIDVQDLQAGKGKEKLEGHIKSDDFFGTAKFASSTLAIKKVTLKSGTDFDVVADLTIKGITAEVTFPATITVSKTEVTAKASFNVDRTKYGIKYGSGSFFENLGDKAINNDFAVEVNIVAAADVAVPAAAKKAKTKASKKATTTSK